MLLGLHGTSTLKIFLILTINYAIAKQCRGSKSGPILTWIFNGAVLFMNDRYGGYQFGHMLSALEFLVRQTANGLNQDNTELFSRISTKEYIPDGISVST